MAIAIMGGLFVATILTLFFVPALYAAWYRAKPVAGEGREVHASQDVDLGEDVVAASGAE